MHSLHFVVIKAESAEKACQAVEFMISDFGTDNNSRVICGSVSEDNEVYNRDGCFQPIDMELTTIEAINKAVNDWLTFEDYSKVIKKLKDTPNFTDKAIWSCHDLMLLRNYVSHLFESYGITTFNVLTDSYKDSEYDINGVTQLADFEGNSVLKKYVVFLDMHN